MKGKHTHRFISNPLEERFAKVWEEQERWHHNLEYLLSSRVNEREHVSEEIQEAAATIIQWLGSPVGQAFLEDALEIDVRGQLPDHLKVR